MANGNTYQFISKTRFYSLIRGRGDRQRVVVVLGGGGSEGRGGGGDCPDWGKYPTQNTPEVMSLFLAPLLRR